MSTRILTSNEYVNRYNQIVIDNIRSLSKIYHTSKSEIAKILRVSERTVDNRLSGNIKTPFTTIELLRLSYLWGIPLKVIISPHSDTIEGLIEELEYEHSTTLSLLKQTIKKGESS